MVLFTECMFEKFVLFTVAWSQAETKYYILPTHISDAYTYRF